MEKSEKERIKQSSYLRIKRGMDIALSGGAIVVLSPVLGAIALAIKLDSPGPVLFRQQRVGKDKELFEIWKFRSMRADTPQDIPTHQLEDPDAYITRTGKFLRRTSLDELPQLFNILRGQMSIVGPRPALWNQDDLVAERDKYGANGVTPGLTGWAQINGRDELEIPVKAKYDGEYVRNMGLRMDIKCFLATIGSVLNHDGVVEGGTGEMHKEGEKTGDGAEALVSQEKLRREIVTGAVAVGAVGAASIGALALFGKHVSSKRKGTTLPSAESHAGRKLLGAAVVGTVAVTVGLYARSRQQAGKIQGEVCPSDARRVGSSEHSGTVQPHPVGDHGEQEETRDGDAMSTEPAAQEERAQAQKRVLITGADSYIGGAVEQWLGRTPEQYQVDTIDMIGEAWRSHEFSPYDVVFHVAGIAHADVGDATEEEKQRYYQVNTDLAVETAEKARDAGVKQFIFMSSMIVYAGCEETRITVDTEPKPLNFYGDSKWQADRKIRELASDAFHVVILRPPMIYGKGSKGNYPELAKFAQRLPVFPEVKNQRSMLYIDNLCQFVKLMMDNEESGVFFPQNAEYTNTSEMVQRIAAAHGRTIVMIPGMSGAVRLMRLIPGRVGAYAEKAFGDLTYEMSMSEYKEDYRVCSLAESIQQTERK